MPNYYVEDYEELTGKKPDSELVETMTATKVMQAPETPDAQSSDVKVETK